MATFPFLRTRKPRGFHYKPRYYDERKERLAALVENARRDLGIDAPEDAALARARIQLRYREAMAQRRPRRGRLVRPMILAGLLILALYFYMNL